MPNWCDTTYTVTGEKEKVKQLYDLITKLNKQPGDLWMGDISYALGGTEDDTARGWVYGIDELSQDGNQFTFYCNTAWGETSEWRYFVEAHADVSILYTAIEPGCDVYLTNDNEYIGKYIIDDDTDVQEYPYSEQEVIDIVNDRYEQHCETIEDCIKFAKQFSDNEDDKFLFINQFMDGE